VNVQHNCKTLFIKLFIQLVFYKLLKTIFMFLLIKLPNVQEKEQILFKKQAFISQSSVMWHKCQHFQVI